MEIYCPCCDSWSCFVQLISSCIYKKHNDWFLLLLLLFPLVSARNTFWISLIRNKKGGSPFQKLHTKRQRNENRFSLFCPVCLPSCKVQFQMLTCCTWEVGAPVLEGEVHALLVDVEGRDGVPGKLDHLVIMIIMFIMVIMVIKVIKVIKVTESGEIVGIITHQGHISKVSICPWLTHSLTHSLTDVHHFLSVLWR